MRLNYQTNLTKPSETSSGGVSERLYTTSWNQKPDLTEKLYFFKKLEEPIKSKTLSEEVYPFIIRVLGSTNASFPSYEKGGIEKIAITQYSIERMPFILKGIEDRLEEIFQRRDNWDDAGSKKVALEIKNRAYKFFEMFLEAISQQGYLWRNPFVSSDEEGNIIIDWHKGKNELHVEITSDGEEYTKVWGANIEHEMHSGIINKGNFISLWSWLIHG